MVQKLINNPQMTYFKAVYKTHPNFIVFNTEIAFIGQPHFNNIITFNIPKAGDLLTRIFIEVQMPVLVSANSSSDPISWVNSIGHALIEYADIEIGGLLIERLHGEWLEIRSELWLAEAQQAQYNIMVGKRHPLEAHNRARKYIIELPFFFAKNYANALYLVGLFNYEAKITIKLRAFSQLWTFLPPRYMTGTKSGTTITATTPFLTSDVGKRVVWANDGDTADSVTTDSTITAVNYNQATVGTSSTISTARTFRLEINDVARTTEIQNLRIYGEYVCLDTEERRHFGTTTQTQLIELVAQIGTTDYKRGQRTLNVSLNSFKLAVKEIIIVCHLMAASTDNDHFNYAATRNHYGYNSDDNNDPIDTVSLHIAGHFAIEDVPATNVRQWTHLKYHTRAAPNRYIYVIPMSLFPESMQSSGFVNFSNSDDKTLVVKFNAAQPDTHVRVYATNYNLLQYMNGMAGLIFSN